MMYDDAGTAPRGILSQLVSRSVRGAAFSSFKGRRYRSVRIEIEFGQERTTLA